MDKSAIIIPPMVGLFFLAAGRHPIAGIICGYAAVQAGFTGFGMIIVFIIFSSFINIFIPSSSSKWAFMAPVFIPMMLLAGNYHPAMTQIFYRIGDSSTNCFTPMMPYMWITLKTAQDMYDPKIKLGTFVSTLLPIGLVLMAAWIVFLFIWMLLGIPVGPGVNIYFK